MPVFNSISNRGILNKIRKRISFLQGLDESSVLTKLTVSIVFDFVWVGRGQRQPQINKLGNEGNLEPSVLSGFKTYTK